MRLGQTRVLFVVLCSGPDVRNDHMTEQSPGNADAVNSPLLLSTRLFLIKVKLKTVQMFFFFKFCLRWMLLQNHVFCDTFPDLEVNRTLLHFSHGEFAP